MNEAIAVRVVISALIGYLLGCISPSFLIGKRRGYDVRETGSKNAGASNTIIMAGKFAGVLVAVLDILKAAASWWIAAALFPELEFAGQIAGAACVLGHMFPVFLGFRGGKGFACLGGLALACGPATFFADGTARGNYRLCEQLYLHRGGVDVGRFPAVLCADHRLVAGCADIAAAVSVHVL